MAAQVLAGVANNGVNIGKRDLTEAEMRGFADDFANALNDVFSNVIQKPLEDALAGEIYEILSYIFGRVFFSDRWRFDVSSSSCWSRYQWY